MRKRILFFVLLISFFFLYVSFAGTGKLPLEIPEVDVDQSGNANITFPLEAPDGTRGLTPGLTLSYNSGSGPGLLGKGWSLSGISFIKRDPNYGISYTSSDRFYSSDHGVLVDINGNRSVYHSKEESFVSFHPQGDSGQGPTEFIAYDKEGNRYTYGSGSSKLSHPNGAVRTWGLSEIREPHGETITFQWETRKGELYLNRVTYAGGVRHIEFEYSERDDIQLDYSEKTEVTRDWLLKRIRFYSQNSHVHSYEFFYSNDSKTKESLLSRIEFENDNFFSLSTHLPLEFTYAPSHSGVISKLGVSSDFITDAIGYDADIVDRAFLMQRELLHMAAAYFFGKPSIKEDARSSFKQLTTDTIVNAVSGGGAFSGYDSNAKRADTNVYNPEVEVLGRYPIGNKNRQSCDIGVLACLCTAFPGCPDIAFVACGDYVFFGAEPCNNGVVSPQQMLIPTDIDGDGISEFSRLLGRMDGNQVYLKGTDFQNNRTYSSPNFPIKYNSFVTIADIDGDGKTDFLYEHNGMLHVSYSNGSGLDSPIPYPNIALVPTSQNYRLTQNYRPRDYAVDLNRDGRSDFVHFSDDRMTIYLSQGRSFASAKTIYYGGNRSLVEETLDTNPFISHRMNQFTDIDGDGIPEHLHIVNVNPPPESGQLIALKERQKQEVADAHGEVNYYKGQINSMLDIGGGDFFHRRNVEASIYHDKRYIYWHFIDQPGTISEAERSDLMKAVEQQFFEVKYREILERHSNELDIEIGRMRNVNLDAAQYQLITTKINLSNNSLSQWATSLPKSIVGYNGKNWFVDINKDGLPDLVTLTNINSHFNPYDYQVQTPAQIQSTISVLFNKGGSIDTNQIVSTSMPTIIKPDRFAERDDPNREKASSFDFVDINQDGNFDFVVKEFASRGYHVYLGDSRGSFPTTSSFSIESEDIASARFEDRNDDGIPDFYYQYGSKLATKQVVSDSPSAKGGLLTKVLNNVPGAETNISYTWKKNMPGSMQKGTGSYSTSLANTSPQMLVSSITSYAGAGLAEIKTEFGYTNSRYKPGDLETSLNLGFETITRRTFVNGENKGRSVSTYIQNGPSEGLLARSETFAGNSSLIEENSFAYTSYSPHVGTRLRVPTNTTKNIYVNGQLKDQVSTTVTYDAAHGYEPMVTEENFNGRTTRQEMSYLSNSSLNVLSLPFESKKFVNGQLVENKKWTYNGVDVASEANLVSSNSWYTLNYTYDGIGNISTTTDSLGRTTSFEYGDITRSKPTLTRNALGQTNQVTYDPKFDFELSMVDVNGNETSFEYDKFGRKVATFYDGNRVESVEYEFDGTLFTTRQTTHSEEGDAWTKNYTDLNGKVVKIENLVTENIISTTETQYDALGREKQKSNTYYSNQTPVWSYIFYNSQLEDTLERPKEIVAATGEVSRFTYGLHSSTVAVTSQSVEIKTETENFDNWGRLISKSTNGESLQYQYDNSNRIVRITDPGSGITEIGYDLGGRKISYSDSNSGTLLYTYNVAGDLLTQTDARGVIIRKEYDNLGRVTQVRPGSETPIVYEYDNGNSLSATNTIGNLSKVTDSSGITELAYDRKKNIIAEKRIIDDLQVIFQRSYDAFNRVTSIRYPEGTLVRNHYTGTGQLSFMTMDSHDGNSLNHTVASYEGPKIENGKYYLERKTGNGVLTKIGYDPLRQRPDTLVTYLKDQTVEQSLKYEYDPKGNIASITDLPNESRNQSFEYDHLNRVTRALGKYGEENYSYHRNGNLLSKGAFSYSYENPNHIHAVTRVNSPNTGIVGYSYDVMGNMIGRNGDSMHYNAQNKLARIDSMGGDRFEYTYDHSGMRIKKSLQNSNTVTYSFGNLYEIHRSPGVEEKHTLYVNGIEGDMIAQYSRNDALLVNQMASNDWLVNPFCKDLAVDCDTYWKNRIGFTFIKFLEDTNVYVNGKLENGHRAIPWVIILALMFLVVYKTKEESKESEGNEAIDFFGISILPKLSNSLHKQIPRYGTALLVVVFSFTSTVGCFPLLLGGGEGESGTPIWLLGVGGGVPVDTPSVGNEPSGGGIGGGSSSGTARISGMYFFHPDHLGSITMITDGNGNVLAGGERGGKSHITYKPYGEILRTDSYGPDIAKFKFTGQEEDKESGLYYYKARYYDASLGRFASNDGMTFPKQAQGMNRMMYVEGNPLKWRDKSGNNISTALAWGIMGALAAPQYGMSAEQGFFAGVEIGRRQERQARGRRIENRALFGRYDKFLDTTLGKDGFLGWTANNYYSIRKINKYVYNSSREYENTSRSEKRELLQWFLVSRQCAAIFGGTNCLNAALMNNRAIGNERKRHNYKVMNPHNGMFAFKIRPTNEDPSRVENDSAAVICLTYYRGSSSGGFTNREKEFVDSYAALYAVNLSCGFTNSSNPGYLGVTIN